MPDERRFFHGTPGTYSFKPGDLLTPEATPYGMRHVYYTSHLPSAARYATWGQPLGEHGLQDLDADALPGHVYEVVPETKDGRRIGRHAEDPASGLPGNEEAYRTKGRLRVLHEVDRVTGEPLADHTAVLDAPVVQHFAAAPMNMQQKLFDMPHDRNVPCPQCGTRVREPGHREDHLEWQRQYDPEYEPDECEHCGADRNFPEEHAERHSDWVRDQQWHTDWDEEGPGDTLHRGMAMSLPKALHDKVHDPSIPVHERAHALLRHILGGNDPGAARGGLGNFWSSDPDVSKSYAESTRIRALDGEDGRQTPVMLHIHTPGQEHFETDPDQLREWGVHSYHVEGNREVPIQHGAPLRIRGISWAPPDHGLRAGGYPSGTPEHLSDDGAWQHHEIGGEGIRATASGALSADDIQLQQEELRALASSSEQGLSWDEIGERHPGLYGDPEVHDDADGSDGPSIGDAASYLAFSRPEDPGAENHSVHDLTFHQRTVDPARIDYARHDPWDPRVRQAREGFRGQDPGGRVPPLVLVHRHGVFQVADGHHRAQGADLEHKPVRAYVAYSPHEDESFGDGERGPYHGAETEDRPALTDHNGRDFRITYEGWPHAAVTPAPHTAALVAHFEEPAFHGTRYSFTPGQVLTTEDAPQVNQGFGNGMPDGVYYSGFASVAGVFAESAMGPDGNINARPRVYLIRPLAAIEADPDEEPQFDSHRTARAEVIGEVAWDDEWFDSNGNPVLSERMRRTALITSSSQNPLCYYCHEPLDDEDIRDGASAHDECDDMRWCEACQEHHDDPQVTEDHNSTYTDWGGHYFEDGIHRGITVRLPDDVHAIVHDESRPSAERAAALASYLHANPVDDDYSHGRAAGYGVHWTDHLPTAQAWGSGEGAMFGPSEHERSDPRWTHVVMHAAAPEDDDFETDPEELSRRNMLGYDHARSEREIPLRDQAPVHLNALSWKPAGSPADAWQRHELPANHHAAIASVVEHFDDDDDEGQLAPPYNGEKLFHGTRSILHPGELLTHQQAAEHSNTPDIGTFHNNPHVFATTRGAEAHEWGERADAAQTDRRMHELGRGREVRHDLGHNLNHAYPPRVYEVEPTGHVEPDPEREGMSYRSASPLRVVREVHPLQCYDCPDTGGNEEHWPDHPHHEYLQSLEDEDREDEDDEFGEHEGSLDEDEGDAHDGDGYTTCDQGHEHWGLNGAAGLLIRHRGNDGQTRYLLQHRSPHVQHGNTWSTPGGAMGSSETPERAALREATEELGELPGDLTHAHTHTDDHGGWAYHTVIMDSPRQFAQRGQGETDWETSGAQWFTPSEMKGLPLHPGFRSSWEGVQHSAVLQVTAADVPSFTHRYETYGNDGGYTPREETVEGPFYHGGRARLEPGGLITPGRKTNGWGDEGAKSTHVYFSTDPGSAASYARSVGGRGHLYEVEPTGDVRMDYQGSDWKTEHPLRVIRRVPPEEWDSLPTGGRRRATGKMLVSANISDKVRPALAPALPGTEIAASALTGWLPQNAAEMHQMLDDFPELFRALHEGLAGVARKLDDSPVSGEITGIVRSMAASCLTAAEDAADIAARPLDGPEGMWEGSLAGKA